MSAPVRLRFRYAKLGKLRWISHRDTARVWERAFRRAGLPIAYSGGFAPRPRVSFGLALPTGAESVAEYLDVDLDRPVEAGEAAGRLAAGLPAGIDVLAAGAVEPGSPSLQQEVTACTWEMGLSGAGEAAVRERVEALLAAGELVVARERKGQQVSDDLRPALRSLAVTGTGAECVAVLAELATQPRGVRPGELAALVGPELSVAGVRRLHQWIERDGARREPLPLAATGAPHAVGRAS